MNNKIEWALSRLRTRVTHFSLATILGLIALDGALTAVIVVIAVRVVQ